VAPQALTEIDVAQLLEAAHRPVAQTPELWRRTKGNPGRIRKALDLQNEGATQLSSMESAVMAQSQSSTQSITEIAAHLKISEHAAVDIAERLVDLGLLEVVDDGHSIRICG
jgi:DNA-binding MarR family transcriptional regulator